MILGAEMSSGKKVKKEVAVEAIRITKSLKDYLDSKKLVSMETYSSVILRLIKRAKK